MTYPAPPRRIRARLRLILAAGLIVAGAQSAAAADIYTEAELAADAPRYAERFAFLLERGMLPFMTPEERRTLADVVIDHPQRGADLLSIRSELLDGLEVINAPVETLKFVEDLSVAYAWRHLSGSGLEPIDEYLAMLWIRPDAFAGGRADPLSALGVPDRVWETDPRVGDLSLRFRNSAWAFILAHELGHWRFGHPSAPASPAETRRQEEQADAFAADVLARSETIPMGMILWFQATAGYYPSRADYDSDASYEAWLRTTAEHPVNGRRMRSLAAAMERQADRATDRDRADVLRFIGARLASIGEIVEDPEMQRYLRRCAEVREPDDLARRGDRPCL